MSWTDERVATLNRLWGEGWSAGQIAVELGGGVSRSAVIGKVHRLKLSARATVVPRPNPRHVKREVVARTKPVPKPKPVTAKPAAEKTAAKAEKPASGLDAASLRRLRSRAWAALPGTTPVGIMHHTCGCRWPVDGGGETLFCNAEVPGKGPYCAKHMALAAPVLPNGEFVGARP